MASRSVDVPASAIAPPLARRLPIAATALRDFDGCPRRFELLHLLGVPEPGGALERPARRDSIVHRVLERIPTDAFGSERASAAALEVAEREAFWMDADAKAARRRASVPLSWSAYARKVSAEGATLERELPFVVELGERPATIIRGTMDLVVRWPKGGIDVLDYKSGATSRASSHAVQLDAYGLAAQSANPEAKVRVGVVPLADERAEPRFRSAQATDAVSARLAELGASVARARARAEYPRVALDQCRALQCGFTGYCHARSEGTQLALFR